MIIPPRFLDDIRARLTLSEIIGKQVKVTRAGREYKACCPFHGEKTPSFTINDQKQFYHCFGCGAHGDVIGFTMQYHNLSFPDAVKQLAAQAGLRMPETKPQDIKREEKRKNLHSLMEDACTFFQNQLTGAYLEYVAQRGISEKMIENFRIGYAPSDGQALRKYLALKNYTDAQMIEAGVLKKSAKGGQPYTFFRERIMFPVADKRGRIVAFGGRILPDNLRTPDRGDFTPPKYINSSDTPLFDKGKILYGESRARMAVRDGNPIIVTEGYMDVIACHQAGFTGAVAPMGTALTEEQILALWHMDTGEMKSPIFCFDGDNAGRRAASRACERILPLLQTGQTARFAFMPEGEDPDTLIKKKGQTAFQGVLDSALNLFDFIWMTHTMGRDFSTPESRATLTKTLYDEISRITVKDLQTHYRRILQDKISETFFPKRGFGGGNNKKPMPVKGLRRPKTNKNDTKNRTILACVLNHPHIFESCEEMVGRIEINTPALDRLRQALIVLNDERPLHEFDFPADLHTFLAAQGFEKEMSDILNETVYVHASFARPEAESDTVCDALMAWLNDMDKNNWHEIQTGWHTALDRSDRDLENQLVKMIELKRSETT